MMVIADRVAFARTFGVDDRLPPLNGDHPDDIQLAIARWLAEYVIDNCEVNDAEVMTLEEALDVYLVVFEDDDYDCVEIELTAVDLGSAGTAEFRRIIAAHEAASEEEEADAG